MSTLTRKIFIDGFLVIFRYLKPYKKVMVFLIFASIIAAAANAAVPYLMGKLIDNILNPAKVFSGAFFEMPVFIFILLLWLAVYLLADFFDWQIRLKSNQLDALLESRYLTKGFSALLYLPLSFHKEKKIGEVSQRIERAARQISLIASRIIINLAPQFLSIVIALIVVFVMRKELALVLFLAVLIYIFILTRLVSRIGGLAQKTFRAFDRAYGDAWDAIQNVSVIKQAAAEEYEKKRFFRSFVVRAANLWIQLQKIWAALNFFQRLVIIFCQLAIFLVSMYFIQQGEMTIGELVMFLAYSQMLFSPFVTLGHNWEIIQNGLIAILRGEKILSLAPEVYHPKDAVILSRLKGEVVFENVGFCYGKKYRVVLDGVSFSVAPGEKVALVGESGVGKTTLVDLISLLYQPTSGKILIDGHNIQKLDLKFLRSQIAVVPQEVVLFNDTIRNNIRYGNFSASDQEVEKAAKLAFADEFIQSFPKKYNQIVGERGIKLSVGQKQRVAIARAILRDPKILILDEPTSALDAKSEKYIQKSLKELMKGRTTFIIAHRLSTVREADKIIVLDKGKVAEIGKHTELLKIPKGIYRRLYELQVGLYR